MRKRLFIASATLAMLFLSACGGSSGSATPGGASSCVNAGAAHHAYVVVTHLDGHSVQRCIGFAEAQIAAEDLMTKSGVEYQAQTFSGLGKAVCQVDNEPKQFSECFPKDQPYWALYTQSAGGTWTAVQTGYTEVKLRDGEALGWRYTPATASPAPVPSPPRK